MLTLRLSDTRSHAEEFQAERLSEFTLGLYEALKRYEQHFESRAHPAPRPHLHIRPNNSWGQRGRWIDAGYGRGTHIVLHNEMMQNTAYLSDIWERCCQAERNSNTFTAGLSELLKNVPGAIKSDD